MSQSLHVVVVGGGLAGLAIGHGLKKNGISYVIAERETTPRDRNWGVTLSWSSPMLEQVLPEHVYAAIQQCQPDPSLNNKAAKKEFVLIRDGRTGKAITEAHFPGVRRLNIGKVKKAWATELNIKYGKRLSEITFGDDGRPIAKFTDGSTETGDIIIGADGGVSAVRRWLLGDELAAQEVLPYAFMNFPTTFTADQARWLDGVMNPNVDVATHPKNMYIGIFLLDKQDLQRPETWIFYFLITWPIDSKEDEENSPNRLERIRRRMDDWADPYKSAISWVRDDIEIRPDQLRIWHPKPWNNHDGKVTLIGDAAHSMTFHRGQGGNLAIRDVYEFVSLMVRVQKGEIKLKEAVDEYDKGVHERGQEVETSKVQTNAFHDFENFLNSPVVKMGIKPGSK